MKRPAVLFGTLVFVTCCDGLTIVGKAQASTIEQKNILSGSHVLSRPQRLSIHLDSGEVSNSENGTQHAGDQAKTNTTVKTKTDEDKVGRKSLALYTAKPNAVLTRPNAGSGPESIKYGLMVMNFYGANLKSHTFSLDMVMSLRWKDHRVVKLIPAGLDKVSMAWSQALKLLWMPGIVVTNRDIEKYEIVSASVTIFRSGEVLRVERAQARCLMKYQLQEYPFDTQHLQIKIASSKYMLEEVQLVADRNSSAVKENIFGLYLLNNWNVHAYESEDGFLRKSRGVLDVEVHRGLAKYTEDHLVPTVIALTISMAVFYFPFANPFITPRLALSILALLTFTNLMVASSKELPGSAPFNYNDLLNQQVQLMMFITIILNICSEISFHTFQNEELARWMNNEAKVIMPTMAAINMTIILSSGEFKLMTLVTATLVTKLSVGMLVVSYGTYIGYGLYYRHFKAKEIEEGEAGLGEDADADADCGCD